MAQDKSGGIGPTTKTLVVTLTTSVLTTPNINISGFSSGVVHVPATSTATSLNYKGNAVEVASSYATAKTFAGASVTTTIAASTAAAYPIPPEMFAYPWIRIQTSTAGTTVTISLKS